ncbi:MAG TPA: endonuclease/exonuclease/phosphatase family protein [Dongiaceae bacterium]
MTETAATPLRRPHRSGFAARLLWLLAAGLLLCQATIWYRPVSPLLALLDEFAVQLTGLALLGLAPALLLRRWRLAAVLAVLAATLSWPVLAHRSQAAVLADGPRLTVLSLNVFEHATTHRLTLERLMASDADIIGLVELTPAWKRDLAPLIAKYPYHVDCVGSELRCEHMLLSKLPIAKPYAGQVWHSQLYLAAGEIMWDGRPVMVIAAHLVWPLLRLEDRDHAQDATPPWYLPGLPPIQQVSEAASLARFLNTLPPDVILMGDMNGVPWGRVQRAFRGKAGLDNAAGWVFSWPSYLPWPLRLPIDHVLTRGHPAVASFATGPKTDSDHLPVVAEIGWRE